MRAAEVRIGINGSNVIFLLSHRFKNLYFSDAR